MAKAGNEPAGTAGSQFYIVTARGRRAAAGLRGDRKGRVRGIDVVESIGKLGDPASGDAGTPVKPVVIKKATVSER